MRIARLDIHYYGERTLNDKDKGKRNVIVLEPDSQNIDRLKLQIGKEVRKITKKFKGYHYSYRS